MLHLVQAGFQSYSTYWLNFKPFKFIGIDSCRVIFGLIWTHALAKEIRVLAVVKESTARGIPIRLATLEMPFSLQQQKGKLGSFIHNGISLTFSLEGPKSQLHF